MKIGAIEVSKQMLRSRYVKLCLSYTHAMASYTHAMSSYV